MDGNGGPPQRRWRILAALCLSVPLAVMDKTILGSRAAAGVIPATLVWHLLRRQDHSPGARPFPQPPFSAASSAITLAFTGLSGFIFLMTQHFQVVPGYDPLKASAPSRWL